MKTDKTPLEQAIHHTDRLTKLAGREGDAQLHALMFKAHVDLLSIKLARMTKPSE